MPQAIKEWHFHGLVMIILKIKTTIIVIMVVFMVTVGN